MKYLYTITIILIIMLSGSNVYAQNNKIVSQYDLFQELYSNNETITKGSLYCHEFDVEVDFVFFIVTTTITVCCSTELLICIPVVENKQQLIESKVKTANIINSSSVIIGGNIIKIQSGNYQVNNKGEIINLNYIITKN